MKVYIVLEFEGSKNRVIDVYGTKQGAANRLLRLSSRETYLRDNITHHIITKSIKGLGGLKFDIVGKQRILSLISKRGK